MENGRTMLFHAVIIGMLLYFYMINILKQPELVAENRSILVASGVLMYMVLFGHGLPTSINKDLF